MAKEFIYSKTREIGTIGKNTVEIGHYTVDAKKCQTRYIWSRNFHGKMELKIQRQLRFVV